MTLSSITVPIVGGPGKFDLSVGLFKGDRIKFTLRAREDRVCLASLVRVEQLDSTLTNWQISGKIAPQNMAGDLVDFSANYSSAKRSGKVHLTLGLGSDKLIWIRSLLRNDIVNLPEFKICVRETQSPGGTDITVLKCSGKMDLGENTIALRKTIRRLVESGIPNVILDLSEVYYVDSVGIAELVSSWTQIGKQGGKLKLLQISQKLQEMLEITKLHTVFDIYDKEREAIISFD